MEWQALAKHILDRYTSITKSLAELNPESADREATLEVDRVFANTAETSKPSNVHMSEEEDDSEEEPLVRRRRNVLVSVAKAYFIWRSPIPQFQAPQRKCVYLIESCVIVPGFFCPDRFPSEEVEGSDPPARNRSRRIACFGVQGIEQAKA